MDVVTKDYIKQTILETFKGRNVSCSDAKKILHEILSEVDKIAKI